MNRADLKGRKGRQPAAYGPRAKEAPRTLKLGPQFCVKHIKHNLLLEIRFADK